MIRLYDDIDVGVSTHTGQVRSHNEDDYLVLSPSAREDVERCGRLLVVADGMGGVSGGAEASRAAVRSLGAVFLASADGESPEEVIRNGFAAACGKVYELSRESPRLHEMGTTMTAVIVARGRATVGHVGDSRCLLVRGGRLNQLTEDHAMAEPRNMLTRCIGAGQPSEDVDVHGVDVAEGDVLVLASDGVWNTVAAQEIARCVRSTSAQAAADRLIETANDRGAPDNCTAIVVRLVRSEPGRLREVGLPTEEAPRPPGAVRPERSLRPARWPWLLLALSCALAAMVVGRVLFGVDPFG